VLNRFTPGAIETEYKVGHDPVTEADPRGSTTFCARTLLRSGEGLALGRDRGTILLGSTNSACGSSIRLDGTREFVQGIPEFCVFDRHGGEWNSGRGRNLQSGNRRTHSRFRAKTGVTYNGKPSQPSQRKDLHGALVLASRSEVKRGEWETV